MISPQPIVGGEYACPRAIFLPSMAKKKTELEEDANRYYSKVEEMRRAHDQRDYQRALARAAAAWDYVDGMMQRTFRGSDRTKQP